MKQKKKNRRNNTKNPALKPEFNLKTRSDLIDYDYLDQLSAKDKAWLNKFTEEYTNDKIDRKHLKRNLHNTNTLKKDCDDRNNSRNRDILTRVKATGRLKAIESINEKDITVMSPEEQLILKEEVAEKLNLMKKRKHKNNTRKNTN